KILTDAGSRLFSLEEEPLTADEQKAFWEARDARYNALAYFVDEIRRSSPTKELLKGRRDLPDLLVAITRARADVKEGSGADVVYKAVLDKLENRVLALQLLSNMEREFNRGTPGIDVFNEGLMVLCAELGATPPNLADLAAFRKAYVPHKRFEF